MATIDKPAIITIDPEAQAAIDRPSRGSRSRSSPPPLPRAELGIHGLNRRIVNWVRFSGSIRPSFVLSHNISMINTTGKLALFWRFSLTASSLSSHYLVTGHYIGRPGFLVSTSIHPRTAVRRGRHAGLLLTPYCQRWSGRSRHT